MRYFVVSEDALQCLAIDNRNYARLDKPSVNDKTLFDNLKRSEANCRKVEVKIAMGAFGLPVYQPLQPLQGDLKQEKNGEAKMHARDLIGKWALRTQPVNGDNSYGNGSPVFIEDVTESHAFIRSTYNKHCSALSGEWMDNWVEWPAHLSHAGIDHKTPDLDDPPTFVHFNDIE
jgi:hypothetical protein